MNITIKINTDNAAFHNDDGDYTRREVVRILQELANHNDSAAYDPEVGDYKNLRDINGNTVGSWEVTK